MKQAFPALAQLGPAANLEQMVMATLLLDFLDFDTV